MTHGMMRAMCHAMKREISERGGGGERELVEEKQKGKK